LYAAGGHDNWILKYAVNNGKLQLNDSIILGKKWPNKIAPSGITIDDDAQILYAVTRDDKSLYVVNLSNKQTTKKIDLGAEAYACQLSADKKTLFISVWGADKVLFFDVASQSIQKEIAVGDNPNEICLTKTINIYLLPMPMIMPLVL